MHPGLSRDAIGSQCVIRQKSDARVRVVKESKTGEVEMHTRGAMTASGPQGQVLYKSMKPSIQVSSLIAQGRRDCATVRQASSPQILITVTGRGPLWGMKESQAQYC